MIEAVLADSIILGQSLSSGLFAVAQLFAKPLDDLWEGYRESRGFTELHEVLLGIKCDSGTLGDYLTRIAGERTMSDLIDLTDSFGRSALSWAVEFGWADAVATLIRFGADINQQRLSFPGRLPMLHLALAGPNFGTEVTAYLDIVQQLLLAGADVNAVDHEGWTALHVAASWKDYKAVRILVESAGQRLSWSVLTNSNESASQLAEGDAALVEFLAGHEINPRFVNFYQLL